MQSRKKCRVASCNSRPHIHANFVGLDLLRVGDRPLKVVGRAIPFISILYDLNVEEVNF